MEKTKTVYKLVGEGRNAPFKTKKALDEYIATHRPANDDNFTVVEQTTITKEYTVKSNFPVVTIDKTELLDVIKKVADIINPTLEYQKNCEVHYSLSGDIMSGFYGRLIGGQTPRSFFKRAGNFLKDWLKNVKVDYIKDFVYNQTNSKDDHCYEIILDNLTDEEEYKEAYKKYEAATSQSYNLQQSMWYDFLRIKRQLVIQGKMAIKILIKENDIIVCNPEDFDLYVQGGKILATKKVSFDADTKKMLIERLDKISKIK